MFHKIGNKYNKISISSGVLKESLKKKRLEELSSEELSTLKEKWIGLLNSIENSVLEANDLLDELRKIVYRRLDSEIQNEIRD